ncbi:urease accessory protein UreD [Tabrizicola sp.]|uniref:urease accessory protein UreD n=1 Tax=Tabrizicola sp. TaxID=2005166 RepID=UPI001A3ED7FB|nr:urease accessory protein UreD [Tabrizicola sp.]MBL9073494.1 urease accessory protein UreD [Tabrizicola sp.]
MIACPASTAERSHGAARLSFRRAGVWTRLERLHQSGSAKAFVHPSVSAPDVVFLNTSGGMTGGDRLSYRLALGAGCRVTATTQTAERAYRSVEGMARVEVSHEVGPGAHLDWLPQETILFDHSALERVTTVSLAAGASCLLLEAVVLGRAAMGEVVRQVNLLDRRQVLRQGVPVLVEPLRLNSTAREAGLGILGKARAFASIALVAEGAEARVAAVRAVLNEPGVQAGASGFDGKLTLRLMAVDGWPMRRQILRVLEVLRDGPPPRVWQM